jgi:hypothetical protein
MAWKPTYATPINASHPLARGLVGAWLFGYPLIQNRAPGATTPVRDLVTAGGGVAGVAPRGLAHYHLVTNATTQLLPVNPVTGACTVVLGLRKSDATLRPSAAFGTLSGSDADACGAHVPYSDGTVYWDYGGQVGGTSRLTVSGLTFGDDDWAFGTGPAGMQIWQNGRLRASNAGTPTRVQGSAAWVLGASVGIVASDLVSHLYCYLYARQLDGGSIQALRVNPYAVFVPPHVRGHGRRKTAAGGAHALFGTSALSLAAVATLTAPVTAGRIFRSRVIA